MGGASVNTREMNCSDPVLARVNFFLYGLQAFREVTAGELGVFHRQLSYDEPTSPAGPLAVSLAPAFSLFPASIVWLASPEKASVMT
jgi:hypothetical protein